MRDETNEMQADDREGSNALLPSQLVPLNAPYDRVPEARLALAVIEDAVLTLQVAARVSTPRARMLAAHATAWILSDDTSQAFGFVALCNYLGLDPSWLRQGLRRAGILRGAVDRVVSRSRRQSRTAA